MPAPSTAAGQTSTPPASVLAALPGSWCAAAGAGAADQAGDVVRWAVFCCVLVPVVLVAYGTSLGGAVGTALGLVSVTAVCRVLLRRSERGLRGEGGRGRRRG
uniref:hypothetical protein n=1 Tax=Streptomyces sp. MSC1_001 TaxID=2909263 RepID=UPI00202E0C62|nr:hypothetical protein [Streptomyces sp. MSC1_001]